MMSRRIQLLALAGVLLLLAACGSAEPAAELTTADPVIEEPADATESDPLQTESDSVVIEAGDDKPVDVEPIIPDAPVVSSPAGRQDAQRLNAVEPEADESVGIQGNTASGSVADADVSGEQSAPAVEAPAGPVIDIPIPTRGVSGEPNPSTPVAPATPFVSAAGPIQDLPADSCGDGCEIGGLEVEVVEPDTFADVQVQGEAGEPADLTIPDEDVDAICPQVAADSCTASSEALLLDDAGTVVDDADSSLELEPDCDSRPWMRGCDGPIIEPEDSEPQEVVNEVEVDESTGVVVPQEVQDVLLTPADE